MRAAKVVPSGTGDRDSQEDDWGRWRVFGQSDTLGDLPTRDDRISFGLDERDSIPSPLVLPMSLSNPLHICNVLLPPYTESHLWLSLSLYLSVNLYFAS